MVRKSSTDPIGKIFAGFILAGGKSLRMGRDKATMEFQHQTLLDHMLQRLSTVTDPVRIVGREDLPDKIPDCGPLGGIWTALAASKSEMNLIVAVDLPLLTAEFLKWFCTRMTATTAAIVACQTGNDFPLCLGVHRSVLPQVAERIQARDFALHRFIRAMEPDIVSEQEILSAGFPLSVFQNVNTPEDWKHFNQ